MCSFITQHNVGILREPAVGMLTVGMSLNGMLILIMFGRLWISLYDGLLFLQTFVCQVCERVSECVCVRVSFMHEIWELLRLLLLSCLVSTVPFEHEIEQIVRHKRACVLTGSAWGTKANLSRTVTSKHTIPGVIMSYIWEDKIWFALELQRQKSSIICSCRANEPIIHPVHRGWCVWGSLTSAKSKKVRLVGIPLQQRRHSVSHSLVALVDEFLAEVVVYLLGCDAVVSWQGAVDELRQLNKKRKGKNLITN